MEQTTTTMDTKSKYVFWFICYFGTFMLIFMAALIFMPVPEKNEQKATMTLSFLFGLLSGVLGVIIYANSDKKKETPPIGGNNNTDNSIKIEQPVQP